MILWESWTISAAVRILRTIFVRLLLILLSCGLTLIFSSRAVSGSSVSGAQGTGKTLSSVKLVKALHKEYPKAIICSNLQIHGLEPECEILPFVDPEQLRTIDNGIAGVIFLIDEIQTVWNSLESRQIPVSEIAELSQNRKNRRVIIGTSQVYGRMAKPVREQMKYIIKCRTLLKYIQVNEVIDPNGEGYTSEDDGHAEGMVVRKTFFFHSPSDYQAYDTYHKIKRVDRGKR